MLTIGSLFSGIGGLELGLEWAGLGPVLWQVEKDPYCLKVLEKHWPGVERYDDVKKIDGTAEPVDLICGGFPCQDISYAGRGAGIKEGTRSSLWFEFARIIRELRPRFVVVENVPALLTRGMDVVLGDLAALRYNAWWDCIPAQAVGAPHRRDRIFIIALRRGRMADTCSHKCDSESRQGRSAREDRSTEKESRRWRISHKFSRESTSQNDETPRVSDDVPDTSVLRRDSISLAEQPLSRPWTNGSQGAVADIDIQRQHTQLFDKSKKECEKRQRYTWGSGFEERSQWAVEPEFCRIFNGISSRLDKGGLNADKGWLPLSCTEITQELLRHVWNSGKLEHTSQGRKFNQQFAGEYPNIVRCLSYEASLEEWQKAMAEISTILLRLRQAVNARSVRNSSVTIQEAWESLSPQEKDWARMATCGRAVWDAGEWPGMQRVVQNVPHRVDRLRALGNAVVPQVSQVIGEIVKELIK